MTTTPNPTAERRIKESLRAAGVIEAGRAMHFKDEPEPVVNAPLGTVVKAVMGLLSEDAPSEEPAYLVTIKLPPNPDHNPRAKRTDACAIAENCTDSTGEHHTYLARSIEEVQRETRHITRIETVALTAAGVAPQEPNQNETKSAQNLVSLDPEKVAEVLWEKQCERVSHGYSINSLSTAHETARALCDAYTEGKLT